jgi:hypothetical protein
VRTELSAVGWSSASQSNNSSDGGPRIVAANRAGCVVTCRCSRLMAHIRVPAARSQRPGFAIMSALEREGAGKAGYPPIPMVRVQQKSTRQNHRISQISGLPAQWFYGLYVISPGTGLIAPVARNARHEHRDLSASTGTPGPHDFAVRAHDGRPPSPTRPSQPASTYRDDAYAPLR